MDRFIISKIADEVEQREEYTYYLIGIDVDYGWEFVERYSEFKCFKKDLDEKLISNLNNLTICSHFIREYPDFFDKKVVEYAKDFNEYGYASNKNYIIEEFQKHAHNFIVDALSMFDMYELNNKNLCLIEDRNGMLEKLFRNGLKEF